MHSGKERKKGVKYTLSDPNVFLPCQQNLIGGDWEGEKKGMDEEEDETINIPVGCKYARKVMV